MHDSILLMATILGFLLGVTLDSAFRVTAAKKERVRVEGEKAHFGQRISSLAAELAASRSEVTQIREQAERRAGFEPVAAERAKAIDALTADRDRAAAELRERAETERRLSAEVSEVRAELLSERISTADKLAVLEQAKKNLSDQLHFLAADRERIAAELRERTESEQRLSAEVSEARAELLGERKSASDKLALLEQVKKNFSEQFQVLAAGRDHVTAELREKTESERRFSAEVSEIRAELLSERKSAADKLDLLEQARQNFSEQFQVLAADRDRIAAELREKTETEQRLSAEVSEVRAELLSERKSAADKLALLEQARQNFSEQYQVLAAGRDRVAAELREKTETERRISAEVSEVRAELLGERKGAADKLDLLEQARQNFSEQVQVLTADRDRVVAELREKTEAERRLSAAVGEVRAELLGERKNAADKLALLEQARQNFSEHFQALTVDRDRVAAELRGAIEAERRLSAEVNEVRAELVSERKGAADKLALLEQARQNFSEQFQVLAAEILDQKTRLIADTSRKDLDTLLNPLREQIGEFRKKVEEAQTDSKLGVNTLQTLIGNLNSMNQQIAQEARSLSTALRGSSKAQGDWGELIVRNLLEKAGLREGEQFLMQEAIETAEDADRPKLRPDVILNLPGGRNLIIDSKVSLAAWSDCVDAVTEDERRDAMTRHLAALRAHIDSLAGRKYHELDTLLSPDFIIMFVPIEPAFLAALQEDDGLWRYAYEKEVLLVGPTTLLFVIRIVDNLWHQEVQARTVQEVLDRGTVLYEKFVSFVSDLESIGDALRNADKSYAGAIQKLSEGPGNLVRQVETLRQLGIKSGKSIPRSLLGATDVDEPLSLSAKTGEAASAELPKNPSHAREGWDSR